MSAYGLKKQYLNEDVYASSYSPRVTESYLHSKYVHSRFQKHTYLAQYALYGFIILALLFGLVQSFRSIVANAYKLTILVNNQGIVNQYYEQAQQENASLRKEISVYSSPSGIEELARNNLDMVGENEILVRTH